MKIKVHFLQDYEAKTATGTRRIVAGTVLDLSREKAEKLITAGIVAPEPGQDAGQPPDRPLFVWITATGRRVYLVETDDEVQAQQRPGEAWFSWRELEVMQGAQPSTIERIIDAKEIFHDAGQLRVSEETQGPPPALSGFLGERKRHRPP